jgi:GNAT superfamily N-acetyltransferase
MTLIRDAKHADKPAWLELWQGFLTFYSARLDPAITEFTWTRLMDQASPLKMRVAEKEDVILGFAIHHHHPSTWVMGDDCYLEDLFVAPAARGHGLGRALIDDLMALARTKGWNRLYWHTDQGNATARRLYDSIIPADGHIRYRVPVA